MEIGRRGVTLLSQLSVDADLDLGTYKLKFANLLLKEYNESALTIRNIGDTDYKGVVASVLNAASAINANILSEYTIDIGITVDGVELKDGLVDGEDMANFIEALTVTLFQANTATGTCTNPQYLNDGTVMYKSEFDVIDENAEVDLGRVCLFTQYRYGGSVANTGDGRFKIQVYFDGVWSDWVTNIATLTAEALSAWTANSMALGSKIRVVCTTVDSGVDGTVISELEVKA